MKTRIIVACIGLPVLLAVLFTPGGVALCVVLGLIFRYAVRFEKDASKM